MSSDKYKVRLQSIPNANDYIIFNVTPEISESKNITYQSMEPVHLPNNIYVYGNTSSRTFNLVIKFISRNLKEATKNSEDLQLLRSWTMPYFGATSKFLGSPPDILTLTAYSNYNAALGANFSGNINRVPVVITQLGNSYPADVDYVPTEHGEPFPVIMSIDLILTETHSPQELTNFKLEDYKNGRLANF